MRVPRDWTQIFYAENQSASKFKVNVATTERAKLFSPHIDECKRQCSNELTSASWWSRRTYAEIGNIWVQHFKTRIFIIQRISRTKILNHFFISSWCDLRNSFCVNLMQIWRNRKTTTAPETLSCKGFGLIQDYFLSDVPLPVRPFVAEIFVSLSRSCILLSILTRPSIKYFMFRQRVLKQRVQTHRDKCFTCGPTKVTVEVNINWKILVYLHRNRKRMRENLLYSVLVPGMA